VFPLGFAVIGLILSLRRPGNPIGWLYAASGLAWSLVVPLQPWVDGLLRDHQALPLAAQVGVVLEDVVWGPAVTLGVTLPALLVPDGRLPSRFNRARYDAARTVAGFAARLREQVDLDALVAEVQAVVDQTVQPTAAWRWLRPPSSPRPPR
jgi:hypothetical protein